MSDTNHTAGRFVWRELYTQDMKAAKRFYGEVAGWRSPVLRDFRQMGLFIGFELDGARLQSLPALQGGKTASIHTARLLLDAGLMTVPAGPNVVRWLPPLNITQSEAAEALRIMRAVLDHLAA